MVAVPCGPSLLLGAAPGIALRDSVYTLPEILVEAERFSDLQALRNSPGFVAIIPMDDASRRVTSAAEYLGQAVGCHVRSTGSYGAYSTASIRGSSAKQVRVYIDGVPLHQAETGVMNLADLPLASVERIEVYRGFGPFDLSGSSIGGVINVVTESPGKHDRGHVSLSLGSLFTRRLQGSYAFGAAGWNILALGSALSSEGDYDFLDTNGTPYNPTDDAMVARINNQIKEYEALLKVSGPLAEGILVASNQFYYRRQGLPGYSTVQSETERLTKTYDLLHLGWRRTFDHALAWELNLGVHGLYQINHFEDRRPKKASVKPDEKNRTVSYGAVGRLQLPLPRIRQALRGMVSLSREGFRPEETFLETVRGEEQIRRTFAVSLEDEIHLVHDRLRLIPSGRYERYTDRMTPFKEVRADLATYFRGMTETELTHSLSTGTISLVANPGKGFTVKADYGRHHRVPAMMELFGYRGSVLPNPGLQPEVGLNRDVGVGWEKASSSGTRVALECVYFWSDVDQLIMFVYVPFAQASQAINIDSADIEGYEVSLSLGSWRGFTLSGNLTSLRALNTGPVSYLNGKHLPNRPGLEAFGRLRWAGRGISAFYEFSYIGGNYWNPYNTRAPNNSGPLFDIRRFHNVGATVPAGIGGTDFTLEVRNLADERFEDIMGYPLPGRSVYGTVAVDF
jgi:iron complex outermembrane receptor protein